MVTAIVLIKVNREAVTQVANALIEMKGVTEVFSVAGNYDLVAIVRVAENDMLTDIVGDGVRKISGIMATETLIAFRTYSRPELEAGFDLGTD